MNKSKLIISLTLIFIFSFCGMVMADTQSAYTNLYNKMDKYVINDDNTPRLIESFSEPYPGGNELAHKAYVYDNALAVLVFLRRGQENDIRRAKIICDGFRNVQNWDPEHDGRIRDAYWATDLAGPSIYDRGSRCGNLAWIIIALVKCYNNDPINNQIYLLGAIDIGNFIINEYKDQAGIGFITGYYLDWGNPPDYTRLLHSKSTEENVDVYVAFEKLYEATEDIRWMANANHAKNFVRSMYNWSQHMYYCGTDEDGNIVTNYFNQTEDANSYPIIRWGANGLYVVDPLPVCDKIVNSEKDDTYTLAKLNLTTNYDISEKEENGISDPGHRTTFYPPPIPWLEENCFIMDASGFEGFDFNTDGDGVWFEGTGNMCIAYHKLNMIPKYSAYLNQLRNSQITDQADPYRNGSLPSASIDYLSTGLGYYYFNSPHLAATCWYIFAEEAYNPFE